MSKTETTVTEVKDDLTEQIEKQRIAAAAIGLCVNAKSHFEMYAYKLIDQAYFISELDQMVENYIQTKSENNG